uniref:Tr-type G domain-containing protein n=1 Tax=Steinernema glaseri TaxID=37863 RepID=A0A1I7ZC12_9BILA
MEFMTSTFSDDVVDEANLQFNKRKKAVSATVTEKRKMNGDVTEYSYLQPENDLGNVEYKARLTNISASRLQHLITQLKWRLREGQGEAIYEIGVEDDGAMKGLEEKELEESLGTLQKMAEALDASLVTLSERDVTPAGSKTKKQVVEVLVRKVPDSQQFIDLKLAVIGCADAGKSTLCGVLTYGELDNGHGKVRLNLFRYLHEIRTGKTSSICMDVIGFDSTGSLVNYKKHSVEDIVECSSKLITLIDLAGDRKYMKTTIYGLTAYAPHFCALVVNAKTGANAVTREHLGIAVALNLPFFVVITKADTVSQAHLEKVQASVETLVKRLSIGRESKLVRTREEAVSAASLLGSMKCVPILTVSSVSGLNIDLLSSFLNVLPPKETSKAKQAQLSRKPPVFHLSRKPPVFHVEELFNVPKVGDVVYGYLTEGVLREGDRIRIGPDSCGHYFQAAIKSIRRNRQPVRSVHPGEAATIAIKKEQTMELQLRREQTMELQLRRGMSIVSADSFAVSCHEFVARFYLLYHPYNEICIGFQGTVFIGAVCQTATIVAMDRPSIQPCAWVTVRFKFYRNPEYVRVGTPMIFREGRTKGMGEVLEVVEPIIAKCS